jgi:hypothetical protein
MTASSCGVSSASFISGSPGRLRGGRIGAAQTSSNWGGAVYCAWVLRDSLLVGDTKRRLTVDGNDSRLREQARLPLMARALTRERQGAW